VDLLIRHKSDRWDERSSTHRGILAFILFMCEMISPKECFLQMIETSVGWDVFLCNLLFLSYFSWAFLFSEDVLRLIEACPRDGIRFPWSRMSTITIMSFLSYRDAVQLHDSY
jgi:hypothetical protein